MAKTLTLMSFYPATNLILILNNYLMNSNGLTVNLIHPNSNESPFFQPDLSDEERIRSLVHQSNIHENYLTSAASSIAQPQIEMQPYLYIVKVGIGTFRSWQSYKEYYLVMDAAKELVWTQCNGCKKCFNQTPKPFPKENSSSFHQALNGSKPLYYEVGYGDGFGTSGILAEETFHIKSNKGSTTKIERFKFGCGLNNNMKYGNIKNNKISGMMGLGWGNLSFLNQINLQSKGKFSYCLPPMSDKLPKTYLKFGDSIVTPRNPKITPLSMVNKKSMYYVELQGISMNKRRLDINPKVFEGKNDGRSGGCVFDTTTRYSRIISPAFEAIRIELELYFPPFKRVKGDLDLELCYKREKSLKLPEVTFHFRGSKADFIMKAESVYEVVVKKTFPGHFKEYFCLAMLRSDSLTVIGSYQQTNQRIIYDTKNKQLVFQGDDCSKNP